MSRRFPRIAAATGLLLAAALTISIVLGGTP